MQLLALASILLWRMTAGSAVFSGWHRLAKTATTHLDWLLCRCMWVFILSHILGGCHGWRFSQCRQRWQITSAALQVLTTALASSASGLDSRTDGSQECSVAAAVAEAVSGSASYLLHNLPPHAGMSCDHKHLGCSMSAASAAWTGLEGKLLSLCCYVLHMSCCERSLAASSAADCLYALYVSPQPCCNTQTPSMT